MATCTGAAHGYVHTITIWLSNGPISRSMCHVMRASQEELSQCATCSPRAESYVAGMEEQTPLFICCKLILAWSYVYVSDFPQIFSFVRDVIQALYCCCFLCLDAFIAHAAYSFIIRALHSSIIHASHRTHSPFMYQPCSLEPP